MSYILDALRKAERDRQLGRTPTLEDVTHAPASAKKSRPSPRTLALIGLVLGLAIALVLVMGRPQETIMADAPIMVNAPTASAPPTAQPAAPVQDAQVVQAEPITPALNPSVETESLDDLLDPTAGPLVAAEARDAAPELAEPRAVAEAAPVEDASLAAIPQAPAEPQPVLGPKLLRDLPENYRSQFPALRVDVHVYDDEPSKRWVMVNGAKYLEASTMVEGPRISEINASGMVLDYRGETVQVPLNR